MLRLGCNKNQNFLNLFFFKKMWEEVLPTESNNISLQHFACSAIYSRWFTSSLPHTALMKLSTIVSQTPPIGRVIRPWEEMTQSVSDLLLKCSMKSHSVAWEFQLLHNSHHSVFTIHFVTKQKDEVQNPFATGICIHLKTWTFKMFEPGKSASSRIHRIPHVNIHIFHSAMDMFCHNVLKSSTICIARGNQKIFTFVW